MLRDQADDALFVAWNHSHQRRRVMAYDLLGVELICPNNPFLQVALVVVVPAVPGLRV
jgi:hypothetical protein